MRDIGVVLKKTWLGTVQNLTSQMRFACETAGFRNGGLNRLGGIVDHDISSKDKTAKVLVHYLVLIAVRGRRDPGGHNAPNLE